jgi:hypothetical protein
MEGLEGVGGQRKKWTPRPPCQKLKDNPGRLYVSFLAESTILR